MVSRRPYGGEDMKKYFFFDIDGTLTTPLTADYPESTREAIRLLIRNGHFVSIATGRMQADAWEVAKTLGIPAVVSDGGNAVTIDGKILYDEGLPLSDCFQMLAETDEEKHPWAAAPYNRKYRITRTPLYLEKVKDRYYETKVDRDFDFRKVEAIHKIFVACTKTEVHEVPLHGLPHVWFSADTMLIEPVHKERGIMEIQKKFYIPDEDIVVFGDGMNDLTMFRKEWMTIAMGNAKPQLKAKARYITDRADEDGIYNACRHFGWI